ncbi:hypothetical protein N0V88_006706 [Collariella sp. IMI 366227]|nr:hypothetical protein N0V88_006706 [Collariella sp. IMI 366227]
MKYFTLLVSALGLLASTSAVPLEERAAQTVNLIFHGGPAQYTMTFPADGTVHATNNNIAPPDYNAFYQCTFHTVNEATLASSISGSGVNQILVGPPTPITGVSCQGTCIPTYGDCYVNGQPVGTCCAGYCAANKCRPWVSPF